MLSPSLRSEHLSLVISIKALPVSLLFINIFYLYICSKGCLIKIDVIGRVIACRNLFLTSMLANHKYYL